jgi:hypothetical protein
MFARSVVKYIMFRASGCKTAFLLAGALLIGLVGQPGDAFAYACNDRHYVNVDGQEVHSPSCGHEDETRTADCRDGSVSFSKHHSGTCSGHGGVAHWD